MGLKTFKIMVCSFLAALLFLSPPVLAEKKTIAVLVPSSSQDLTTVYKLIIKGIEKNTEQFEKEIRWLTDNNEEDIKKWLVNKKFLAVVTIGNKSTDLATSISLHSHLISTGTLLSNNKSYGGISLSVAQNILQKTLRQYLPHINKLHIGDEGENIIWFSDNLDAPEIIKQKIGHEQTAIVQYLWKTINRVDPKTEAVWVNNNIEHLFLYKLSERAWERNVTLISNNISHLESGSLLAIFPDFKAMGERTGDLLTTLIKKKQPVKISLEPLSTIQLGINLRTAQHLRVEIPSSTEKDFRVIIK